MRIEILSEFVRVDKDSSIAFNYGNQSINDEDALNGNEIVLLCVWVNVIVTMFNIGVY